MRQAVVALVLLAFALGLAGCGSSQPRVVRGAPPPPNAAELRTLARLALKVSKSAGDSHPTDAIVVPTTRRIAEAVDAGSGVGYKSTPAYFIVMHGNYTECNVPVPPRASCPTGAILTLTVDPRTNESTDGGLETKMPDTNKIGKSEPLPISSSG